MRLAEISDATLRLYDTDRATARAEARAGRLWARDRRTLTFAPSEDIASWLFGGAPVERVTTSSMSEDTISKVRLRRMGILDVRVEVVARGRVVYDLHVDGAAMVGELLSVQNHIDALTQLPAAQAPTQPHR